MASQILSAFEVHSTVAPSERPVQGTVTKAMLGVRGERTGDGAEHGVELGRVEQQALVGRRADDRGEEVLLTADAADVGAVADAVPHPGEREGLVAGEQVRAGGELEVALLVIDRGGQADVHAAEGVDHGLEAEEVDHDVVVDEHAGQLLDRLDRAARAALGERRVDPAGDRPEGRVTHESRGMLTPIALCRSPEMWNRIVVSLCPVPLAVSAALPKPLPWPVRVSVPITRMFTGSSSAGPVGVALVGRWEPSWAVTSTVVMLPLSRFRVSQPAALTVVASTVSTLATATARRSTVCRGR
jgi:hypothetical protein